MPDHVWLSRFWEDADFDATDCCTGLKHVRSRVVADHQRTVSIPRDLHRRPAPGCAIAHLACLGGEGVAGGITQRSAGWQHGDVRREIRGGAAVVLEEDGVVAAIGCGQAGDLGAAAHPIKGAPAQGQKDDEQAERHERGQHSHGRAGDRIVDEAAAFPCHRNAYIAAAGSRQAASHEARSEGDGGGEPWSRAIPLLTDQGRAAQDVTGSDQCHRGFILSHRRNILFPVSRSAFPPGAPMNSILSWCCAWWVLLGRGRRSTPMSSSFIGMSRGAKPVPVWQTEQKDDPESGRAVLAAYAKISATTSRNAGSTGPPSNSSSSCSVTGSCPSASTVTVLAQRSTSQMSGTPAS